MGAFAEETACKISNEDLTAIPAKFAQGIAKRIQYAAEMGDVITLNTIEEIKTQSDSCVPMSKRIVQMAEDFEFDGILKLADDVIGCDI